MNRLRINRGFTLVELVIAIAIMAALALGSIRYITATAQAFAISARVSALASGGRIAIERMNREVRAAVPNTLRVNDGNTCLEFLPVIGATRYISSEVGLPEGASSRYQNHSNSPPLAGGTFSKPFPLVLPSTQFSVMEPDADVVINPANTAWVLINPQNAGDVYGQVNPGPLAGFSGKAANGTGVMEDVTMEFPHAFGSNSESERVYFAGNPISYCVGADGLLRRYAEYTLGAAEVDPDNPPAGSTVMVIAANIANNAPAPGPVIDPDQVFTFSESAQVRKAIVNILFKFEFRGQELVLNHEIQMRNTP